MNTKYLYNQWASSYDDVQNKTRDLELKAGQEMLAPIPFDYVLELGCGTGKNTRWLSAKAKRVTAVDFSDEMMEKAKGKITSPHVEFKQADISKAWGFVNDKPDLITCSLILEHISDLNFIFQQAASVLSSGAYFYICELHPYKQYSGSKARFETEKGLQVLECFTHHVSDYIEGAITNGFELESLKEWFDDDDTTQPPRLISFLFQRQ